STTRKARRQPRNRSRYGSRRNERSRSGRRITRQGRVHMKAESFFDTYCGPAPMPQDIWASWNFDPWLVGALVAAWALWRQTGRRDRTGTHCFRAAGLLVILAFISPLCALSAALFSA